jgi:putative transposase, yhgA-like
MASEFSESKMEGEIIIGAIDAITKAYIRKNEVFADAFNYFMYDGAQVIQPEQLKELDPTEIAILFNENNTKEPQNAKKEIIQKYRDHLKLATIKEDGESAYILLGVENQTDVNYAMPVRNMLYDALQYTRQVTMIADKHRAQKGKSEYGASNRAEFISGFHKNDKLLPVITLVLFFNADEWDGPRSLMDMMEITNPIIRRLVVDYPIYVIAPQSLKDSDFEKFRSSLREVMGCIKYSKDKRKLADFISNNPRMNMELTAARVIEAINHVPIKIEEGVDRFDMCQAIEEMIEDGRKEERHRINQLNILLSEKNRTEDIVKAALDKEYQEQLLKEFDIE